MMKCVGVKHKMGEMYDEHDKLVQWNYIRFSCICDGVEDNYGMSAEIIKVKRDDFFRICGMDFKDYKNFVDKEVEALYTLSENKPVLSKFRIVSEKTNK